jgi:hypothetical protein
LAILLPARRCSGADRRAWNRRKNCRQTANEGRAKMGENLITFLALGCLGWD